MELSDDHLEELRVAKKLLENPSIAAKISNMLGYPIEKGFELLPADWSDAVSTITKSTLEKALDFVVSTMNCKDHSAASNFIHKLAAATSGATGGAFGLPALPIELPVSTLIMLRSIADIARSEGEDLETPESRLYCLEVFALGGTSKKDDASEVGYFGIRSAMAKAVSEAAEYIARKGMIEKGAPAIVRLIAQIASRFGIVVSEKAAAQAIPAIGAAGGAVVNTIFIDHFQDMARGHFTVRRLERTYDPETVKAAYFGL